MYFQKAKHLYSIVYGVRRGVPPATPMARLAHREVPLDGYPIPAWASRVAVPCINQGRDSGTTLARSALEPVREICGDNGGDPIIRIAILLQGRPDWRGQSAMWPQ